MNNERSIIIDAYAHISPPRYTGKLRKDHPGFYNQILGNSPPLFDMEHRFRIMDLYPEVVQVLTVGPVPPLESFANPQQSAELARMANEEMAELVSKYRQRFVTAIALLPMNNIDAALKETDRAINELGFRGIYVHSNINGKPLDENEFLPLWEKMAKYNLPIYIHPWRPNSFSDYETEKESKYMIAGTFGWPYETTVAMTRLVFSGILEKYPGLKIVTHHCGGMVPYLEQRIIGSYDHAQLLRGSKYQQGLTKSPIEYYKMFYYDTSIYGSTPGLMCAYAFCGADHMLFASDMPYDS